ncbi:MAG: hypothetical protein GY856_39905 [bacterium]|nr:hypothetical protein [bacterium]
MNGGHDAHQRLLLILWGAYLVAAVTVMGLMWLCRPGAGKSFSLSSERSELSRALGWTWEDFPPPVTDLERERIRTDLRMDRALMAGDLRPWKVALEHSTEQPEQSTEQPEQSAEQPERTAEQPEQSETAGEVREALKEAILKMDALLAGGHLRPGALEIQRREEPRGVPAKTCNEAIDTLSRARNLSLRSEPSRWRALYNRAVVYLWLGDAVRAAEDLQEAERIVAGLDPARVGIEPAVLLEAAAVTRYALGHAHLLRGGAGERDRAIATFHKATQDLVGLHQNGAYPESASARDRFQLRSTGLSSLALWNDLVAAYMEADGYHACDRRPTRDPCGEDGAGTGPDACRRDLCASRDRLGPTFQDIFTRRFERFFLDAKTSEEAWESEPLLWALATLVDVAAENSVLHDDPYLLYNAALLLLRIGSIEDALGFASRAHAGASRQSGFDREAAQRLAKLEVVLQILEGGEIRQARSQRSRNPSHVRRLYLKLYGGDARPPFPSVAKYFDDQAQAAFLDQWLFIHTWRRLLKEGEFDDYLGEYRRLTAGPETLPGFLEQWHEAVLTQFSREAVARMHKHEAAGDQGEARIIRDFLLESGHFPAAMTAGIGGFRRWWPRLWGASYGLVLALVVLGLFFVRGLLALHRRSFVSAHRERRLAFFSRSPAPAPKIGDDDDDESGTRSPEPRTPGAGSEPASAGEAVDNPLEYYP